MKRIKSLQELRKIAKNGIEVSILLNYGLKSTKYVEYSKNGWYIDNYIDGSTTTKLANTNIKEAIRKGALVYEL